MVLGWVCRLFPKTREALAIVRPDTVVRWHRAGFRCYWRWKSRPRWGRPRVPAEIRQLIREMSVANPLWGAPRIHGELVKLGIDIGQTSVAKYMAPRRGPPSQGWKTFLHNHADGIAAMDLYVVPTLSFRLLYGLLIMGHGRRQILWCGVTAHPTAEWGWRTFLRNHAPDIAAMDLFVVLTVGFEVLYAFVIIRLDRRDLVWVNVTTSPTAEWIARQLTEAFPGMRRRAT